MIISIIIPVYREAGRIRESIEAIRLLDGYTESGVEMIVSDGDGDGSTIKALSGLNTIKILSPKGRGAQMNSGARSAKGDVLLFLHADSVLPAGALNLIQEALSDSTAAGGAFSLGFDSQKIFYKIIALATNIRARLSRIPYGDQAIFMRKDIYNKIGGYKDIPILEDVDLMKRLRKSGLKMVLLKEKVWTSPRRWEKGGRLATTLKHRLISLLYAVGFKPESLAGLRRMNNSERSGRRNDA